MDLKLIRKIQSVLRPELLSKKWQKYVKQYRLNKYAGHCYYASEALYHLWGKSNGYRPRRVMVMSFDMGDQMISHWYLQNDKGKIIDITAKQFSNSVPYKDGKRAAFMTKTPSKHAKVLMNLIKK